jgi:hypothetical protein
VESALEQTRPPDEVVICDDGSPDDLEEALGPLRERVRIVRQENRGVGRAMDAAVRAATGELVVWLDQDDAFMPRRLEGIEAAAVERPDLDVIATDAFLECDGKAIARLGDVVAFDEDDQRATILSGKAFFLWPAIRRSRLLALGGFDGSYKVVADFEFFVRLIVDGGLVGFVDEPLYRHEIRVGSLLSDAGEHYREKARAIAQAIETGRLSEPEREVAEGAVAANERAALAQSTRQAVAQRRPGARRLAWRFLSTGGFPLRSRAKAAAALVSPRLARRLMLARATQAELLRHAVEGDQAARQALRSLAASEGAT